jgi:growth arrest-specific protein 8
MGKKKKGGKAKAPKELTPEEIEAAEKEAKRQLVDAELMAMNAQIKKEQDDFNEFQQQREKLNYFWIVEKKNLEDKKSDLRNKVRELQDLEEKHNVEIKVYKQRVKHLLFEHQNEATHLKTESETTLKLLEDEHRVGISELKKDRRSLMIDLKELELAHEDYLKSLKQDQDRNITNLRQEFERKAKELQLTYDKKMKEVRNRKEDDRKQQITSIEQQKDAHIKRLMKKHEQAFAEIKSYYTDITHNNLDLIKSLKEEVAQMKKEELADEKMMLEISNENKHMSEPLKKALSDVEKLRAELNDYQRDKMYLKEVKAEILVFEQKMKGLGWEHEVLLQRYERTQSERDRLYEQFQNSVFNVQQKSGFKHLLLEKRLSALGESLEKKEAQLNEVLVSANLSPAVLGQMSKKLDDVVEAKNEMVRELNAELERVVTLHNDAIAAYEAKLAEYGVPKEELGFMPAMEPYPNPIEV